MMSLRSRMAPLLFLSLLIALLSSAPHCECKKGHPKERHHGSDRIGKNKTVAIAINKLTTQPLLDTPTTPQQQQHTTKLTSHASTHDYLSSLLPPQASSTRRASQPPMARSPSRSLSVRPSHFHKVYHNVSVHKGNRSAARDEEGEHEEEDEETEVVLTDSYHVMYTAEVSIGTPPQRFNMILDTGSSCLWAISAAPGSADSPTPHPHYLHYYDHHDSSTYLPDGRDWEIQYGVGACTGFLSRDAVTLATLTSSNQTFAEATRLSANFLNPQQPLDGIVGMSFAGGACKDHRTFIESLYDEGVIERRVFSFHLDTREGEDEVNVLVIGDEEGAADEGERVVYTDVLHAPKHEPAMWFVHLEDMTIVYANGVVPPSLHNDSLRFDDDDDEKEDGSGRHERGHRRSDRSRDNEDDSENDSEDVFRLRERREASQRLRSFLDQHRTDDQLSDLMTNTLSFCGPSTGPCIALPDTGTSFLTLPTRLFILLVSLITHGRDDCIIDSLSNLFCLGDINTLPSLAFTFNGQRFLLTPADYVLPNRQLAVQVLDFGIDQLNIVILGDVFLRRVRVVFDEEAWRVGFVVKPGQTRDGLPGSGDQWVGGGREGVHMTGVSIWGLLLVLGFLCCMGGLCCCVLVDCVWRRWRRTADYEPIPQQV